MPAWMDLEPTKVPYIFVCGFRLLILIEMLKLYCSESHDNKSTEYNSVKH